MNSFKNSFKNLAKLINQTTKIKELPDAFLFMYNEAVGRLDTPRKPSPSYHPSSIWGCCRNLYFQIVQADLDAGATMDYQILEMADSGTDRHERIQKAIIQMQKLGYPIEWVDIEKYLENREDLGTRVKAVKGLEFALFNDIYNMSFRCDGLIRFKGKLYILEIKTEIEMKWIGRTCPSFDHLKQATAYSLALGIEDVMFIYENRNTCAKKIYIQTIETDDRDQIQDKIDYVDSFVKDGIVPPKEESLNNCKYCNYKKECLRW